VSGFQPALKLKQGVTLALDLFVTDDLGNAVNLAAATAQLVIYDLLGDQYAALTPALTGGQQGWATVTAATGTWPVGALAAELQLTANGVVQISDTFHIIIQRPVAA
jgi:hypothetical protein